MKRLAALGILGGLFSTLVTGAFASDCGPFQYSLKRNNAPNFKYIVFVDKYDDFFEIVVNDELKKRYTFNSNPANPRERFDVTPFLEANRINIVRIRGINRAFNPGEPNNVNPGHTIYTFPQSGQLHDCFRQYPWWGFEVVLLDHTYTIHP